MDQAAIKAYSSVIADAAEDSEPATPVVYSATIPDEDRRPTHDIYSPDPMASMTKTKLKGHAYTKWQNRFWKYAQQ